MTHKCEEKREEERKEKNKKNFLSYLPWFYIGEIILLDLFPISEVQRAFFFFLFFISDNNRCGNNCSRHRADVHDERLARCRCQRLSISVNSVSNTPPHTRACVEYIAMFCNERSRRSLLKSWREKRAAYHAASRDRVEVEDNGELLAAATFVAQRSTLFFVHLENSTFLMNGNPYLVSVHRGDCYRQQLWYIQEKINVRERQRGRSTSRLSAWLLTCVCARRSKLNFE